MDGKELSYFQIGRSYGGNQRWFLDFWMHIGGCGALTMCDLMIYMALHRGRQDCVPFDASKITRRDYVKFGMQMKPYLRPRETGIKDLETFIEGAEDYLREKNIQGIMLQGFSGDEPYESAEQTVIDQIGHGIPVPMLMLNHQRKEFSFFEWHWFPLVGYEEKREGGRKVCYVKAATYGKAHWLRFDRLWDTGEEERGGLIIVREGQ
ncbi:MAG: hypothetical protein IJJ01_02470 [Firmicutes bacterium]|nr:hypothetical protein [Bacillota bacterium]